MSSQLYIWVGTPQGTTMAQGVAETVISECQSVIDWIEVLTLPQPEKVQTCQWCFIVWTEANLCM